MLAIRIGLTFIAVASLTIVSCKGDRHNADQTPGDSGDTDTGTESNESDSECEGVDFPVSGHPPVVVFVLDRSSSMTSVGNAWMQCSTAVKGICEKMDHQVQFGLFFFPSHGVVCGLDDQEPEVPVAPINSHQIKTTLEETIAGGYGTPTAAGLEAAYMYLTGLGLSASPYVVLATDGGPNCSSNPYMSCDTCVSSTGQPCTDPRLCLDDQNVYAQVTEYHDTWGIQTFVIGLGGVWDVWDDVMSTIAQLGGTGDYYPVETENGPDDLKDALQEIAAQTTECTFDVDWSSLGPDVSQDPNMVNLLVDGVPVVFSENCVDPAGWHWLDEDTMELCPDLCHQYKWGEVSVVHASFGCETLIE